MLFGCVILVFAFGSCVKDGKSFLSCTGIYRPEPVKEVAFRAFDPDNNEDARLVTSLIKLARVAGMDLDKIRVAIAVDPHINAMTIGTDTFVLCEGLDKLTDEALDAVMAHEVGHAIKDHSDRSSKMVNTVNKVARIAGALVGAEEDTKDEVASWAVDVAFAPYSQGQELEADRVGVEFLKEAGYPLNAVEVMCAALDAIAKQERDTGGGFLSTHPSIPARIDAIRKNSQNITGPLSENQYWGALTTILTESGRPYKHFDSDLSAQVVSVGERAALADIVAQGADRLEAGEALIQKMSALPPPAEYEEMHEQMMSLFSGLQAALTHQLEAAKRHDLKGALAAEAEALHVVEASAAVFQLLEEKGKKHFDAGG
jgi:hypothetical protein